MWADDLSKEIIKEKGEKILVSSMITPSGPVHLGNLREVMTGYLISEALRKQGAKASFFFFADNFDHLRRVYPFLSEDYQKYVGMPLSEIPDPFKCHKKYDQHFLEPFFKALKILNIKPRIYFVDKLYKTGIYAPLIKKALQNRDKIVQILEKLTRRKIERDWSPFMPLCQKCGKISETKVTDMALAKNLVFYQCACGSKGKADFSKGEGKLVWRVHWPATWRIFGVNVEGFGKDHATKGGAYETGRAIVEQIFNGKAPYPVPYEWIYIKGQGPMASSTGVGFTPLEVLEILPPEILTYFYERSRPSKHLQFNPVEIANLWNEYGGLSSIPFEHLVMVAQSSPNFDGILETLKRTGYGKNLKSQISNLKTEINCIKNWLEKYAPEDYKFEVQEKIPKIKLTQKQKEFLSNILRTFESEKLDGEKLHQKIHQIKKEMKIDPREAFSAIYLVFLGKDSGPQAGWFLASLDREFVLNRLKKVIK
jgi:lysyl-tRNA synthetase class 1